MQYTKRLYNNRLTFKLMLFKPYKMMLLTVVVFFCFYTNVIGEDGITSETQYSNNEKLNGVNYNLEVISRENESENKKINDDYKYDFDIDFSEYKRKEKTRYLYNEEEKAKLDEIFGYTGPTANDEPENLIRPCARDDWQCVRQYFATNSKCSPSYGPIPDPLKISPTIFFTAINVTTKFPNSIIRGLSTAKINDFYVNKKSGNLVFAIDVQNLNQTTPRSYFRFRRTGKESIVLAGYSTVNFDTATFTAVIPKVPHLRLDLADVHVDIQNGYPSYFIGPEAFNSTDPDVIEAAAQFPILLPILVREGLFFEAQLLTAIYIQKNICDFGLKLIDV